MATLRAAVQSAEPRSNFQDREGYFAIYSAYFGSSNNKTFNTTRVANECAHYFLSNNDDVLRCAERAGWIPLFVNLPVSANKVESAQQSKVAKAVPHIFPALLNHRFLAYVDDKLTFNVGKFTEMTQTMVIGEYSFLIREHPSLRGNVLNEFAASMIQPRYQAQRDQTVEYIDRQLKSGLQLKVDKLYWTSALLRDMHHPDTVKINEAWYEDILDCGIECQISFDFIAQRFFSIGLMPQEIS
jgi:hypothetical protein